MCPTEILKQEHRVIEQVLDCLEILAQRGEANGNLDWNSAKQAIDFFQNFADRCHHGKEEECLFPMLEQKGFSPDQGPTGVMRSEHELGRHHVREMAEAIKSLSQNPSGSIPRPGKSAQSNDFETCSKSAADGSSSAIAGFASHARAYVRLLRDHIQKEDHCLFQMADQALNEQEQSQLMSSFEQVEHDDMGTGTHQKYLDIATQLADRFGVPSVETETSGCGSCCHHG